MADVVPQTDATASAISSAGPILSDPAATSTNAASAPPSAGPAEGGEPKPEVAGENGEEEKNEEEEEDPNKLPDDACETLYLQNLNEKVRIPVIQQTLENLFKPYRAILPIVAHRSVRMRGQAFVSFPDVETANKARKDVAEFPLYGKPIQVSFAKSRSDSVVKKLESETKFEEHTKQRLEAKKEKRKNNPLRQKQQAKLKAEDEPAAGAGAPAAKKQRLQMPDEYLPPNSVLFIQNLPEGTTADDLREVFEVHAGLVEIRTIPAKKDIAFVEFGDEAAATVAKEALHNFKIDGETKMKVTYARK